MKKIYIIDDDQDIVEAISLVLKANGYDVKFQYNDENVVENIASYDPDLIILDVIFPEDESAGFRIGRDISRNKNISDIPVIMLSAVNEKGIYGGHFSDHDIDPSWMPVTQFIDKPVQPKELLKIINNTLNK